MARRRVYTDVMHIVERRIAAGDYMLKDIPGERRLAEEAGVSYMTARKAVQELIARRVLSRRPNGSLVVHPGSRKDRPARVALLTPAYPSPHLVRCRAAATQAADRQNVLLRPVEYVHWHDPVVREAVEGSDGLFVIPSTEPIPPSLLKTFGTGEHKVVFFDDDMTAHGIPSIRLFASGHIVRLFEHLWTQGHRRIDCLNTQGRNDEIERRIGEWQAWMEARGATGALWDWPAEPFADPLVNGSAAMRHVLAKRTRPEAIVCTTQPAALGAMRACYDAGLAVGRDLAICTINNEPTGRYFCPSLTGLEFPEVDPLLEPCFAWFRSKHQRWSGSLLLTPSAPMLFAGESTGGGSAGARGSPRRTKARSVGAAR
jgi:DNA-binding LacI/PurR family transcriptional regulator